MTALDRRGAARVLLVMNEPLANLVSLTLQHLDIEVRAVRRVKDASELLKREAAHLIIGDVDHEPKVLGLAGEKVPVLVMTRRRDTPGKLAAFDNGAHDVLEVPFTPDEIVARTVAAIRRTHGIRIPIVPRIRIGTLQVDILKENVRLDGRIVHLTPLQHTLLYLLAANAGTILTRDQILDDLWGPDFAVESNVVDRHIRDLRVKLTDDWREPRYIETVPRQGYRFSISSKVSHVA